MRSAYRRLSRRIHPDKNSSQGATEAFKKLSVAYRSLLAGEGEVTTENVFRNGFHKWPWEHWEEDEQEEEEEESRSKREAWADWVREQEQVQRKTQEGRRRRDEIRFMLTSSLFLLLLVSLALSVFPTKLARQGQEKEQHEPAIQELSSQKLLFQQCSPARKTLCLLLLLPPLDQCDHSCRLQHISSLATLRRRLLRLPYGWLWLERGQQGVLEKELGLAAPAPLLVVANFGRGLAWHRKLPEEGLGAWVRRCGRGQEQGGWRIMGEGLPRVREERGSWAYRNLLWWLWK